MMDMPAGLAIKPLSPLCGAEIVGGDLSQELPQQTIEAIQGLGISMWCLSSEAKSYRRKLS